MAPTPAQLKALQVLTYTFPLLPLMKHLPRPAPVPTRQRSPQQGLPQGQVIRRFGINVRVGRAPAPRAPAPDAEGRVIFDDEDPRAYFPPVPEFRFQFQFHLPPSRVLLQLLFTLSRAALLLYFFAPARQPLWLTCIIGWIGWEIYVVLRHTGRERERGQGPAGENQQQNAEAAVGRRAGVQGNAPVAGANAQEENQAANGGDALTPADGAGGPNPPATLARAPNTNEIIHFINRIAHMNLAAESNALNVAVRPPPIAPAPGAAMPPPGGGPPGPPAEQRAEQPLENAAVEAAVEPSLVHRSTTFLALFVTSLFPVIWERRRARLRARERWVRDMFIHGRPSIDTQAPRTVDSGAPAPQPSGPEVAQRRVEALAGWRRAYVERVISGEAGDDGEP